MHLDEATVIPVLFTIRRRVTARTGRWPRTRRRWRRRGRRARARAGARRGASRRSRDRVCSSVRLSYSVSLPRPPLSVSRFMPARAAATCRLRSQPAPLPRGSGAAAIGCAQRTLHSAQLHRLSGVWKRLEQFQHHEALRSCERVRERVGQVCARHSHAVLLRACRRLRLHARGIRTQPELRYITMPTMHAPRVKAQASARS